MIGFRKETVDQFQSESLPIIKFIPVPIVGNYNPQPMLSCGCQLSMLINDKQFKDNIYDWFWKRNS